MTSGTRDRSAKSDAGEPVDLSDSSYDIYECRQCDNVVLVIGRDDPPLACHGHPMDPVTESPVPVDPPELPDVLLSAFGLPKAGLDICLCVIGEGPLPAGDVADRLGYDRSTVTRYLNELVEFGLLDRTTLNREDGGVINVYHSIDLEQMRRDTLVGFYVWAGQAAELIEEANLTKRDYLEANPDQSLPDVFWEDSSTE